MLLAARFDAAPLREARLGAWAVVASHAGAILPLTLATVAAIALFLGSALRETLAWLEDRPHPRRAALLLAHLAAFAAFVVLTALVFDRPAATGRVGPSWVAAWGATGLAALALWGASVMPAADWLLLARRRGPIVAAAAGLAGAAFALRWFADAWLPPLTRLTFWLTHRLLAAVTESVVVRPDTAVLGTPDFLIEISPPCAGYEGITLVSLFLGAYVWLFRRALRLPRALVLIPLGALLAWLANGVRLAGLVAVGSWLSPAVAAGGLHASAGTLFVCAIALGLAVSAQRVPWLLRVRETALAAASPTAAYLAPLLAIIVTALLTTAVSTGTIDLFYGARVVVAGAVLWRFRSRYRNLGWTASWGAVAAGVGVFGLWVALGAATPDLAADEALRGELTRMPAGLALCWMAFRVAGSVVTAPLAEELAFRGYLVRRFIARDVETVSLRTFSWRAAVGSSLLFGALHEAWVAGTLAGLAYALVLARRGQLGDPVVAHATTNALLAGYAVATGSWSVMG